MIAFQKTSLLVLMTVLAPHAFAASPDCVAPPKLDAKFLEGEIAKSTTAIQGEVITADPEPPLGLDAFDQKVTFRVLHTWKGPYHSGEKRAYTRATPSRISKRAGRPIVSVADPNTTLNSSLC